MKVVKGLIVVLIVAAIGGYGYWQFNKQGIVQNTIKNALQKKTDSLYILHYDSAQIDEVNGNATFYKISLQEDTAQLRVIQLRDSLPSVLLSITVKEVSVKGIDMAGLLQKQRVAARSIVLINPVITLTSTGANNQKGFTPADTMALYQKIIGKFNSIQADTIRIAGASVYFIDANGQTLSRLQNINITLNNFLVDSTKNYQHIIGYFIKEVQVEVEHIDLPAAKNGTKVSMNHFIYNAPEKLIRVKEIIQLNKNKQAISTLNAILINGLNTDEFIAHQNLKATLLSSAGGAITIFKNKKKNKSGEEGMELSSPLIDEIQVNAIELGNTTINIVDPLKPAEAPFKIIEVKFKAANIMSITRGSLLSDLVNTSDWDFTAGGFSFVLKKQFYTLTAKAIAVNNTKSTVSVQQVLLQPVLSQQQWNKINRVQKDRMQLKFDHIFLTGINVKKLVGTGALEIETATMEPTLKIYNDRTLPFDTSSRVGKYPHQSLLKLAFPFFCKKISVHNGTIIYTEKGLKSKQEGGPRFSKIQADISNVTNMPAKIKLNGLMQVKANALFMGVAAIKTQWQLPLNKTDSVISITGSLDKLDAVVLNPITKPLGLLEIKTGTIQQLLFHLKCTNYKGEGKVSFLYNDLTVKVLKPTDEGLQKRGLLTVLANTLVKNNNPAKGKVPYTSTVNFNRDISKSFFNLIWKTILQGVKKTAL